MIQKDAMAILTGISINTIRGMIAICAIGKFHGRFFTPILDPKAVVKGYLGIKG